MQLLLLILMLFGGKEIQTLLGQVQPILEELGEEEFSKAMQEVETITKEFTSSTPTPKTTSANFFPLRPVSQIADRKITYALSEYFYEQEKQTTP